MELLQAHPEWPLAFAQAVLDREIELLCATILYDCITGVTYRRVVVTTSVGGGSAKR